MTPSEQPDRLPVPDPAELIKDWDFKDKVTAAVVVSMGSHLDFLHFTLSHPQLPIQRTILNRFGDVL
jgi:hypothetical protein